MANSSTPNHLPQLDALRAFAVLSVLAYHWLPELQATFAAGRYGVRLFFVISGFLITGILLRLRATTLAGEQSFAISMRQFYMRRVLRIFPLFYLVVITAAVLGIPNIRQQFVWHILYLSNVLFALKGYSGYASHFWSLAVEEQFYLLWPAIVLLLRPRALKPVLLGMVAIGPAWRITATLLGARTEAAWLPVFACLDSLALGALLALAWERSDESFARKCLLAGVPLAAFAILTDALNFAPKLHHGVSDLAGSLLFVWLVDGAAHGFSGIGGAILRNPLLRYVGKISYGIYVYHFFVPYGLHRAGLKPMLDSVPWSVNVIIFTVVTIAISALSWHAFEAPINNLKRFVSYTPRRRSVVLEPERTGAAALT